MTTPKTSLFLRLLWIPLLAGLLASCQSGSSQETPKTFKARHAFSFKIPEGAKHVGIWLARPQDVPYSRVSDFELETRNPTAITKDSEGNTYVYIELKNPEPGAYKVAETFTVESRELHVSPEAARTRPLNDKERSELGAFLAGYTQAPVNETYRGVAKDILKGETNPVRAARLIYDYLLGHVEYWVKDPEHKKASGKGSADITHKTCTGNCTDFHALYLSLSRSAGFPARVIYGSMFKAPLDGKDTDQSYHCWIEFFAPNIGWIPLDVALADVYHEPIELTEANRQKIELTTADRYRGVDAAMVDYYFGHLEPRRVVWSVGRDLRLDRQKAAIPVDNMAKAYWEVDGVPGGDYERKLTYTQIP